MKNLYKKVALLVIILTISSCQTEDIKSSDIDNKTTDIAEEKNFPGFDVEVKNGRLSFSTRESYDKAIEFLGPLNTEGFIDWETNLGFKSMRAGLTLKDRNELAIYDDLLATLLSPDAIIEIAGNIFKLDAINETVSVISSSNFNKSGFTGKNIVVFSTDDNILDIIEGKDVPLSATDKARYCSKRKLSWNYRFSNATNKIHAKVVYQKAGFLNSLQSMIEEELGLDGTSAWNMLLKTSGNNFWRNKKRSGTIPSHTSSIFNAARKSYRPYYSSRRLKSYRFSIEFNAQLKTGGNLERKLITIDCY